MDKIFLNPVPGGDPDQPQSTTLALNRLVAGPRPPTPTGWRLGKRVFLFAFAGFVVLNTRVLVVFQGLDFPCPVWRSAPGRTSRRSPVSR